MRKKVLAFYQKLGDRAHKQRYGVEKRIKERSTDESMGRIRLLLIGDKSLNEIGHMYMYIYILWFVVLGKKLIRCFLTLFR